jgi:hypothetical protein
MAVAYTVTYAGVGRHVIADLAPGIYSVTRAGAVILTNQTIAADGILSFTSPSGDFSVSLQGTGGLVSACDVNGDGAVNVLDVQNAIAQVLGMAPCNTADLDRNGVCNIVDVERVINAVIGGSCIVGP